MILWLGEGCFEIPSLRDFNCFPYFEVVTFKFGSLEGYEYFWFWFET